MEIIDYARPTILAEKALKDMHNAMLEKKYVDALVYAFDASKHLNEAMQAIIVEKEIAGKASACP